MRTKNTSEIFFHDDFEVTYEDEPSILYEEEESDFQTQNLRRDSRRESIHYNHAYDYEDGYTDDNETFYRDTENAPYRHTGREGRNVSRRYAESSEGGRRKKRGSQRRTPHPARLAAPIQKGGNAVLRIVRMLVRNLTLFLMIGIMLFMGYNFYRGSTPYGDIQEAVASNTYTMTLAVYFTFAAAWLFYEILSMLWAMTRARVRDEYGSHREDVGRGLSSFVFLYLCSHAAFLFGSLVPESHEILLGLKGALDVFGAMHNTLFGLCLAGVASCLFRKFIISV